MASFRHTDESVELWVTNDTLAPVEGTATLAMALLAGGEAWTIPVPFAVPAKASRCVWQQPVQTGADRILTVRGDAFPANRLLSVPVKDLELTPDPGLTMRSTTVGDALHVTITAARYALAVHLRSDDPALRYDDNHFDLAGGETRTIVVTHHQRAPLAPGMLELACWNHRMPR